MYFHELLKLFSNKKNENNEAQVSTSDDSEPIELSPEKVTDSSNLIVEPEPDQVQESNASVSSDDNTSIPEKDDHYQRIQKLADKAYAESGASFYSEIFPERVTTPRSSRLNATAVISPSMVSEYYDLCSANISHLKPGDILRVRENGVYNHLNGLVCDLSNIESQVTYRDKLKVKEIFAATNTAPAYIKVEQVGFDDLLIDYIEVNRSHTKTHDGQNLLSVARDYAEKTPRSKENFGYKLQLVEDLTGCTVVLYWGQIETSANDINFGDSGQGTDGCIVLGTISKGLLSETAQSQMTAITDEYDRHHPYLRCLHWKLKLELIVEDGQIRLCIFDTEPVKNNKADTISQQEFPANNSGERNYIRIENGKYRCSQSNQAFVSSWYFEKRHNVQLNDVDVLRAAQADGVQHDKKCHIEFESARKIWGEYVYMYPEKWLEQQSSRLW
ncbi:hypothetical protein BCU19_20960 [Vibrio cyclitrophicus]|uniref:hypothetical protein n=1 Tax=Vibrio cyclitrophicus TaxID=47951 RepID=UPI000C83F322|nr:hypothetical protein [Vibrio cyclitrophicus]PMJ53685.1 hypothetical protein BCU19_03165 [Vibrio cyclitrophicus]